VDGTGPAPTLAAMARPAEPARSTPPAVRWLPLWLVLAGCAGYRLWFLTTPQAVLDGDEAMTGLMVRRILAGHPYAFLADQRYNGAVEQYLQAATWAVLPQTPFTLRLAEVGLAVLACWLVYRVGRELLGPGRGWLAAALFALGPFFAVWKGVRSHGAYPTSEVLGLLAIWVALRLRADAPAARRLAAAFGLVAGAAAWSAWAAAYLLLPAAAWLAPQLRRRPGLLGPLAGGALAGYLPALAWAVVHRHLPLLVGPQPASTPAGRLRLLFGPVSREFIGVGYFGAAPGWPAAAQTAAVLALAAAYLYACWRRRSGLLALLRLRADGRAPADLLLLVPPVATGLYALSKYTWWAGEPRYLFAAYPALALGLAALPPRQRPAGATRRAGRPAAVASYRAGRTRRAGWAAAVASYRAGRTRWAGWAAAVAVALLVVVGATSVGTAVRHAGDGDAGRDDCLRQAAGWLAGHRVTAAYSDYWTGMPLQLLAGDGYGLSVGPMDSGRAKFPELRRAADAAPPAYVLSHAPDQLGQAPDQVEAMDRALAAHHVRATRTQVGCTTVYTDLSPPLRPWELGVGKVLRPDR
jgi:4-amino-4-deoxy-L-arabinose transferase-like glycosyltransferase